MVLPSVTSLSPVRTAAIELTLAPLQSAADARAADAWTIGTIGVPGIVLMEHAGRAVADIVASRLRPPRHGGLDRGVDVVCGPGNNGGDGWVCARHLAGRGVPVRVLATRAPDELTGDAALAAKLLMQARAQRLSDVVVVTGTAGELATLVRQGRAAVVVDALFGTGLRRQLDEPLAGLVTSINERRARGAVVVAVDLPSGLFTDGQGFAGVVVDADVTVTFGGRKIAHVAEPGFSRCGEIIDVDIGLLRAPGEDTGVFAVDDVRLPALSPLAHKGHYGHVGVVLGAPSTAGAASLSARAALRAGAGLVSVLGDVDRAIRPPEVMARALDDEGLAALDVLVLGPGLPEGEARALVPVVARARARARARGLRVVADAGALSALPAGLADVWTPHPGEAARVLGVRSDEVQADRLAAARALVGRWQGVVILKGAAPVVASSSRAVIVPGGSPALAVGGSGDVLAGVVGAALAGALGVSTVEGCALAAAWLHQQAGRRLRRGAFAGEIADGIAEIIAEARDGARRP